MECKKGINHKNSYTTISNEEMTFKIFIMKKNFNLVLVFLLFIGVISCREKKEHLEKENLKLAICQLKKYFGIGSDTTHMNIDSNFYGNNNLANKFHIDTTDIAFFNIQSIGLTIYYFDYFYLQPLYGFSEELQDVYIEHKIIDCTKGLLIQDRNTDNFFVYLKSTNVIGRHNTPLLATRDMGYVPFDKSELGCYFRRNDQFFYLHENSSYKLSALLNSLPPESKANINRAVLDSLFRIWIFNEKYDDYSDNTSKFSELAQHSLQSNKQKILQEMNIFLNKIENNTERESEGFYLNENQKRKNIINFKSFMKFVGENFEKENFYVYFFNWDSEFFPYVLITVNEENNYSNKTYSLNDNFVSTIELYNSLINTPDSLMYNVKIYQFYAKPIYEKINKY